MSDPFEAMRIPREQGSSPAAPAAPGQPPRQQPPAQQHVPVQPGPAPQQGRPLGAPSSAPLPGPSDDPFEQMRIRPEALQQPARPPVEAAPRGGAPSAAPLYGKSKTILADVPHLRAYSGSATLGVRLFARVIDVVFVAAVAVGIWFLLAYLLEGKLVLDFSVSGYLAFAFAFVALNLLYEAVCSQFGGSTIGRAIFKLHVVQYNTGELMDTSTSLVRQLLPSAALLVPYAGAVLAPLTYLSALWDPTRLKRDWTDRLTETTWVRRV